MTEFTRKIERDKRIARAYRLIRERPFDPLSLGTLAEDVGLSPFYLQRCFKAEFGITPLALQTRLRLQYAREALVQSDVDPLSLCFDLGYASPGTFWSWFKRHTGLPPSAYRSNVRKIYVMPTLALPRPPGCFALIFTGALPIARSKKPAVAEGASLAARTSQRRTP